MNFIFESTVCQVVFWLVLALTFVIIEAITLGLTTIWFAGGSVAALIAGILGAEFLAPVCHIPMRFDSSSRIHEKDIYQKNLRLAKIRRIP